MSAQACIAQFNIEMGIPSIREGISSNFTIIGTYARVGYQNQRIGYSILFSRASILNDFINKKSIGLTADYEIKLKKNNQLIIKPGLMTMFTKNKFNDPLFNNNVYAIGPKVSIQLELRKRISFISHSSLMYGIQKQKINQLNNTVYHFPIIAPIGINYIINN